jgi:diguanylate cyclase (GGDEF)-like protein/PAS domain S-box-containing protein
VLVGATGQTGAVGEGDDRARRDEVDLLDFAFEHARNGLALIDAQGHVLRINAAGAAMLGLTPAQLTGTQAFDLIHRDDLPSVLEELGHTAEQGHGGPLDMRIHHQDGRTVWIRAQATRLPGTPSTSHVMFEDVSSIHDLAERFDETTTQLRREHEARVSRAHAFAAVAALTQTTTDDLDELLAGVTRVAIDHVADVAAVVLLDEADATIRVAQVGHRDPGAEAVLRDLLVGQRFGEPRGAIGDAIDGGVPVLDVQGPLHPALGAILTGYDRRIPVGQRHLFPMQTPAGPVGALVLMRAEGAEPFGTGDQDLAMVLASRAALAVQNVRLEAKRRAAEAVIERRLAQQAAVAQLGSLALSGAPLEDLADECRKLIETTLGVAQCGVLVDDGHPDGLLLLAVSEPFAPQGGGFRYPTDPGLQAVFEVEGSILVPDLLTEERFTPNPLMLELGIRSMVATRIEPRTGGTGVLSASSTRLADFAAEDLIFMEAMANVLASAIDAKSALDDLRHNALHDALTGLPNRVLVLDRLGVALEQATARGSQVAVLACDLDRFKVVNDGLGHGAGDEVLQIVAERLRLQVRPGDTVGRFGGDEFIVVCPDIGDVDAVVAIAERLGRALSQPMPLLATELVVTASIGIAFGDGVGPAAAAELLRDADAAMYRAKDRGRARYELFDNAMRTRASTRLRVESELRQGIERGELVLHYQPVIELAGDTVVGVEALVRWNHATRGLLEPADFLPVARECGLLPDLGAWVLATAARQAAAWERAHPERPWWVAVNLAPRQLVDPQLLRRVDAAIAGADVDPARLRVELTEEALIEDAGHAADVLGALRARGIGISVDDFGTGYSSLAYLKRLPVDAVKLDRGFVAGVGEDGDDMVIAAAVIVMAQALGLHVVAEGVETEQQLHVLRAMGCDQAQGYFFARPLPVAELEAWLAAR